MYFQEVPDHSFGCNLCFMLHTERRGCVVNTTVSYYEVPDSNLGPETGYPE
jgi:hypothetical protein